MNITKLKVYGHYRMQYKKNILLFVVDKKEQP